MSVVRLIPIVTWPSENVPRRPRPAWQPMHFYEPHLWAAKYTAQIANGLSNVLLRYIAHSLMSLYICWNLLQHSLEPFALHCSFCFRASGSNHLSIHTPAWTVVVLRAWWTCRPSFKNQTTTTKAPDTSQPLYFWYRWMKHCSSRRTQQSSWTSAEWLPDVVTGPGRGGTDKNTFVIQCYYAIAAHRLDSACSAVVNNGCFSVLPIRRWLSFCYRTFCSFSHSLWK